MIGHIELVRAECVHTNVVRALADVVAIKLGIILFGANERTHVVRGRANVVATKLGIILSFFFFPSTYFSPRRGLPRKLKFGG